MKLTHEHIIEATWQSKTGTTHAKVAALSEIFEELHTISTFALEGEGDSKKLERLDTRANRLRRELSEVLIQSGHGVDRADLLAELAEPIRTTRTQSVYTNQAARYTPQLLDAGFTKDEINRIYNPAIKRYIKSPHYNPFDNPAC